MTLYEKIFVGVAIILIVAAVIVTLLPADIPEPEEELSELDREGMKIINTSVNMGRGMEDYTYSYSEKSNGYTETYKLVKSGDEKYVETDDILSLKKVYFLEDDSILCIDYMEQGVCSSTKNNTDARLKQYYNYLKSKFFDEIKMANEEGVVKDLFSGGYLVINDVTDDEINGHACRMISYVIDYREMTISEAGRYGIGPSSPKYFEWQICADDEKAYYKYFTYTHGGKLHEWEFTLSELEESASIGAPEELTEGAYDILVEQMSKKGELSNCLNNMAGEDRDRCIAKVALDIMSEELCEVAGERRDRCLVSIMPFLLDETICEKIIDESFRDDCYIEMSGGMKDNSYCDNIVNESKIELCMDVSREDYGTEIPEEEPEEEIEEPVNETEDTSEIIEELFEQVEGYNETNSTEEN